jgi:hypothetical protein
MSRPLAFVILAAALAVAVTACTSSAETATPSPRPARISPTAPSATAAPVAIPTPGQTDFDISVSNVSLHLPDSISFHLQGRGERPIQFVDLEFGSDATFSCASSSYRSARTTLEGSKDVSVTKEWDMRRTGSVPPGAVVWWRWRVVDDIGQEFFSPRQEVIYNDERFDWRMHTSDNITFYWYAGGNSFGRRLADSVRDVLANLHLGRDLTTPVKAFVYESADDLRGAVLFPQSWTGGLAFTSHNILLITVDPGEFDTDISGMIHELAHLLVSELTFNCFGDLPTWLEEGLAMYAEGDLTDYQRISLEAAIASDDLISLRSLNSSFPADHSGAHLSYVQSWSLVDYLITAYGWPKMQSLLNMFAEGATYEQAIKRIYRMDLDGLQAAWFQSLEHGSR